MNREDIVIQNPWSLLTHRRFDLLAKYIYALQRERGVNSNWYKELYLNHIYVWNGFKEYNNPEKNSSEAYLNYFNALLDEIKLKGFDHNKSKIWVDAVGNLINGSHRVAACMLYNTPVFGEIRNPNEGQLNCSYYYFKGPEGLYDPTGIKSLYADAMALHYVEFKKNTYILTLFPNTCGMTEQIAKFILERGVKIVYHKFVQLNYFGLFNLIKIMYDKESWIGTWSNQFAGIKNKTDSCMGNNDTRFFLIECDYDELVTIKNYIRSLFNMGNHSVHINDTHEQTLKLAQTAFNENSIHFVCQSTLYFSKCENFLIFFNQYKDILRDNDLKNDFLCRWQRNIICLWPKRL